MGWFPFFRHRDVQTLGGIEFRILRNGRGPRRYTFLHGDENTAREVLQLHMQAYEGTGFSVTGATRTVQIESLQIDPNRLFTRYGAEQSLRNLNAAATSDQIGVALDRMDHERPKLLRAILPLKKSRLVSLHNNRNYSVLDEDSASDDTSIKQPGFPRNFFLCTDPKDFAVLRGSPFNVVLQSKPNPDDGSLSRLAARQGFRYINLECGLEELESQLERLRWLEEHVP